MGKKLLGLIGLFGLLAVVALYFLVFGRPSESRANPIRKAGINNLRRIEIQNPSGNTTLEKINGVWMLTAPARDFTDPVLLDNILSTLENFSIGILVSENPAKYGQYRLVGPDTTHIRAFVKEGDAPILDGYIGKSATSASDSYFRFATSTPVYVANELPEVEFARAPNTYRLSRGLVFLSSEVTSIQILEPNKSAVELVRSSATWVRQRDGKVFTAEMLTPLLSRLEMIRVSSYGSGTEPETALGFQKNPLKFTIHTASATLALTFGLDAAKTGGGPGDDVYAKADGRDSILLFRKEVVNDLIATLKVLQ